MPHLYQTDEISLTCCARDFDKYSWDFFLQDMRAGFSVAMLTVPQAMAYALVAGLPVSCGLVAVIFTAVVVAMFGSSRHVMVGPGNAIAILVQGGISQILLNYYRDVSGAEKEVLVLQILTQLLLLIGIIQIMAAFFKLGRLTHFVSHSVIIAYIAGVALALVINQLFTLVGMPVPGDVVSLFERFVYFFTHLNLIHWPTAIVGISCFGFLLALRRINHKLPAGAIMLVFVSLVATCIDYSLSYLANDHIAWFNLESFERIIQDIQLVGNTGSDGLIPHLGLPHFNPGIMNDLLPVAFAIALLSVMETNSAAKSVAASSGQHLSTNQEILASGIGHVFSAFIGAMPVAGSVSRTTISFFNGAKTRLASVFNSLSVFIILLVFGFLVQRIPMAAFAALLIVSATNIVNVKQLAVCLKATRSDALVLVLTICSCIFFSLDIAFYIGVVMSITLYLKKAAIPQLVEFSIDESGMLHSIDAGQIHEPRQIRFIKVEGELFFGAADLFQNALKTIAEDDTTTRIIILQLKNARDLDATACLALQQLYEYLRNSDRHLICCGLMQQSWDVMSDSGLVELIGKRNLFFFNEKQPHLYIKKAFTLAHTILDQEKSAALVAPVVLTDRQVELPEGRAVILPDPIS
jgi:SulP family sulfate permease